MLVREQDVKNDLNELKVKYGNTKESFKYVAFFDKVFKDNKYNEETKKWEAIDAVKLYIYIELLGDKSTRVIKEAREKRVSNKSGELKLVHEKDLYKRAYGKYLQYKENNGKIKSEKDDEIERLKKELEKEKSKKKVVKSATKSKEKIKVDNDTSNNKPEHS